MAGISKRKWIMTQIEYVLAAASVQQSDDHLTDPSGKPLCGADAVLRHWAPIDLDTCKCEICCAKARDLMKGDE